MRVTIPTLLLAALASLGPRTPAQESPEKTFYTAFYQHYGLRDLEQAAKTYARAAEEAAKADDRPLAVKATVAGARLLGRMGRTEEGKRLLEATLERYPDDEELKEVLGALAIGHKDPLQEQVDRLVGRLGGAEPDWEAIRELQRLGDAAVPYLSPYLRDTREKVVNGVAQTLRGMSTMTAAEAVIHAVDESAAAAAERATSPVPIRLWVDLVPCIDRILNYFFDGVADLPGLRVAEAALRHPDLEIQIMGARNLGSRQGWFANDEIAAAANEVFKRVIDGGALPVIDAALSRIVAPMDLAGLAPLVVPCLMDALRSDNQARRLWALELWPRWADATPDAQRPSVEAAVAKAALPFLQTNPDQTRLAVDALLALRRWTPAIAHALVRAAKAALTRQWPNDDRLRWVSELKSRKDLFDVATTADLLTLYGILKSMKRSDVDAILELITQRAIPGEGDAVFQQGLQVLTSAEALDGWISAMKSHIQDPGVLWHLLENSEDPRVRTAVYGALSWIMRRLVEEGNALPEARPPAVLLEDLRSDDAVLRRQARVFSYYIPHPDLIPALRANAAKEERGGEMHLVNTLLTLAKIAGKDALPDIMAWLEKHPSSSVASALPELLGDDVVPTYVRLANERHVSPEKLAGYLKNRIQRAAFIKQVSRPSSDLIHHAMTSLPDEDFPDYILGVMDRTDVPTLIAASKAAGAKHVTQAWPRLLELLEHANESVRTAAKHALEEIRWYHEVKASLETFGITDRSAAFKTAKEMATSQDPIQRRGAAFALAALGDAGAVPLLLTLLNDEDATVREAATNALQRLAGPTPK